MESCSLRALGLYSGNSVCSGRKSKEWAGVLGTAGWPVRSRRVNFSDTGVEELSKKWRMEITVAGEGGGKAEKICMNNEEGS